MNSDRRLAHGRSRGDKKAPHDTLAETLPLQARAPTTDIQPPSKPAASPEAAATRGAFGVRLGLACCSLLLLGALALIYRLDLENQRLRVTASEIRERADNLVDYMLFKLRDQLEPIGRSELLEQPARQALEYLDAVGQADATAEVRHRRGVALDNIGQILALRGDLPAAESVFRQASEIAQRLAAEQPENAVWQRGLAIGFIRMGDLELERNDPTAAMAHHRQALEILDRLAQQRPGDRERQYDLGLAHERLGSVLQAQGKLSEALKEFQARQIIALSLHTLDPDHVLWLRDFAVSYGAIGDLYDASGDSAGALAAYRQFAELAERAAAQNPSDIESQRAVAISQEKLGDRYAARGDLAGAKAAYQRLADISAQLAVLDPNNIQFQRDLAASRSRLAVVAEKQGKVDEAGGLQRQSAEGLMVLANRLGTEASRREAGIAWAKLAWYELLQRKPDHALEIARTGLVTAPTEPRAALNLAHALLLSGRTHEAEKLYRQYRQATIAGERGWSQAVAEDFETLKSRGIVHPDMRRIERDIKSGR